MLTVADVIGAENLGNGSFGSASKRIETVELNNSINLLRITNTPRLPGSRDPLIIPGTGGRLNDGSTGSADVTVDSTGTLKLWLRTGCFDGSFGVEGVSFLRCRYSDRDI